MKVISIALLVLVGLPNIKEKKELIEEVEVVQQDSLKYWKQQAMETRISLSRQEKIANRMAKDLEELRKKLKDCESKK